MFFLVHSGFRPQSSCCASRSSTPRSIVSYCSVSWCAVKQRRDGRTYESQERQFETHPHTHANGTILDVFECSGDGICAYERAVHQRGCARPVIICASVCGGASYSRRNHRTRRKYDFHGIRRNREGAREHCVEGTRGVDSGVSAVLTAEKKRQSGSSSWLTALRPRL